MKIIIILAILFPLFSVGQVFETVTGPPIYLSKKYIRDNKIKCLNFSETRGHSKNKPYMSAKYNLVFDSTGTLIKMKSFDTLKITSDITQYLHDYIDTKDLKNHYDTVIYDGNRNIVRTTKYEYKTYYTYDNKNRLSQRINITPQAASTPVFDKTQFIYGDEGRLIELIIQKGKIDYNSAGIVHIYIKYSFTYTKDLLTSIQHTEYKDYKVDYSYTINVEYTGNIISKIEHTDKAMKDFLTISVDQCE